MEKSFLQWIALILERYLPMFIKGAGTTMFIAIIGTIVGLCIGLLVGTIKTIPTHKKMPVIKKTCINGLKGLLTAYIEIFRGTPMIVQATLLYFGTMEAFGWDWTPLGAALTIVSINTGAYMAEIVRGGIESIDKGQFEAAHALGMGHWTTMFDIILPQALRNILPSVGNEFVVNIKDTAVLNVIQVTELYFTARSINGALLRTYEVFIIVAIIYFVLTFTTTRILRYIERRMDGPNSYSIHGSGTGDGSTIKIQKEA